MKLHATYTATCFKTCGFCYSDEYEHEVLEKMLAHIKSQHRQLYRTLKREGRRLAMSQNGLGYFDDGKSKSDKHGWNSAQATFRAAWIRHALERRLKQA